MNEIIKNDLKTSDRGTIYYMGEFGMGIRIIQGRDVEVFTAPYAQYADAVRVTFIPKGCRRRVMITKTSGPVLVLRGWGHPEPDSAMTEPVTEGETVTSRSRHMAFDDAWLTEFNARIDPYLADHPDAMVADYRTHSAKSRL